MLHTKAIGKASIVLGSPSLGTTPPKMDAVFGSIASRRAICRVSISVVVDDVAILVDFQHGFEFGVGDDVHGGQKCCSEMKFDAQVAFLYQIEAGSVALVGGQIETEEGVTVSVVVASQTVPFVLPDFAGRGEQTRVAPDEEVVLEVGLEGFQKLVMSPNKISPLNDIEATMRVLRTQRYEWVTTTKQSPYINRANEGAWVWDVSDERGVSNVEIFEDQQQHAG